MKMKNPILTLSLIALLSGRINNSYSQNSKSSENSKVLIYGESNHMSEKQKDFLINSADSLKKEGYNYFAIELPVEMDSSIQNYLTSDKNYQDENIKYILQNKPSRDALEMVAYNFYKCGFKVIPIDEGKDYYLIYLLSEHTLLETIDKPKKKIKINNERDFYMAKNIEKILEKDPSAKILAYTGSFHAKEIMKKQKIKKRRLAFPLKYPTMAEILNKKGINPETICLTEEANLEDSKYFDKIIYLK